MNEIENPQVAEKFKNYPENIRHKLMFLRQVVLDTASESEGVSIQEEALRWGEPGYITKSGSTIRMDWKESKPDQYAMYFHCKTKLIDTFKALYSDKLNFEGNRAIVFQVDEELPINELKHCVFLSLTYHHRKHLPLLGA